MPEQSKPTRFRSRHASYRFRNLQFISCVAVTADESLITAAQRDPSFGRGRDFWIDDTPARIMETAAAAGGGGGGKNEIPKPEPLDAAKLGKLNKDALLELCTQRDIPVWPDATRADMIALLTPSAAPASKS
jgi:hypothetical protein